LCSSVGRRRKRGTQNQAIGKSRGGLTTKIAVIVDALRNPIRFVLLPGQRHDITSFDALMAGIYCLALIGDKGFDAGWLRERLRANDMEAVIPLREGTSGHAEHDRKKYKWRYLVENFLCSIKAFRRIATRRHFGLVVDEKDAVYACGGCIASRSKRKPHVPDIRLVRIRADLKSQFLAHVDHRRIFLEDLAFNAAVVL
jgi:transposase